MKIKFSMFNEAGAHLNGRLTYTAGEALERGDILKFSSGKVVKCTAATDVAIGVALDGAAANEILSVAVLGSFTGTIVVKATGAVTQGSKISPAGVAPTGSGALTIGVALEATSAAGLIEMTHCVPVL